MDNESMIRICASAFAVAEVEKAKKLLFESVKTNKRNVSRRKDGKIQRDLEDIIAVFKESDPDGIPVFVARDLNKLPPVTFDHVDVTSLLKDITKLKSDITEIKQTYATYKQVEELESKWINNRYASIINTDNSRINVRRGGYLLDSGPMAIQTPTTEQHMFEVTDHGQHCDANLSLHQLQDNIPINNSGERGAISSSPSHARLVSTPDTICSSQLRSPSCAHEPAYRCMDVYSKKGTKECMTSGKTADLSKHNVITVPLRKLSFAEITATGDEWKKPEVDEKWIQVQKKRLRNKFIGKMGKANLTSNSKFKAADIKVPLFVSNVAIDVSESDIIDYIYEKTSERVSLLKMKMKKQKGYNSYKVFVSNSKIDVFLDRNLWPCGITFRRFINFGQNERRPDQCPSSDGNGLDKPTN